MSFNNLLNEAAFNDLPLEYKGPLQDYKRYIVKTSTFKGRSSSYLMVTLRVTEIGFDMLEKLKNELGLLSVSPSYEFKGGIVLNFPIKVEEN